MSPFINASAFYVPASMCISRTYNLFRSMSLRHLAVVDERNQLLGIIGRKNLIGHFLQEGVKRKEYVLRGGT
jgi:CBS-domain-containing membrane protein